MSEKRLPQVGEIWWNRNGDKTGIIKGNLNIMFPLLSDTLGDSYTKKGTYWEYGSEYGLDLVLIHSDATGNVINPEFNGGVPMAAKMTSSKKVKLTSQDPLIAKITDTVAMLEWLTELRKKRDELHEAKVKTKRLTEEYRELRAKWMPEKANKSAKRK